MLIERREFFSYSLERRGVVEFEELVFFSLRAFFLVTFPSSFPLSSTRAESVLSTQRARFDSASVPSVLAPKLACSVASEGTPGRENSERRFLRFRIDGLERESEQKGIFHPVRSPLN